MANPQKKELAKQIRDIGESLAPTASDDQFPTLDELNALRTTITKLHSALGRQKPNYQEGWKAFCRVDNKYPNLGVKQVCFRLLTKIESLPLGPMTRITQTIQKPSTDSPTQKALQEIVPLLDHVSLPPANCRSWENDYFILRPFVSPQFEPNLLQRPPNLQDYDWIEKKKPFQRVIGWTAFLDIREQAQNWNRSNPPGSTICRAWLQGLNSDEIDARLWKISRLDSPALPVAELRSDRAKRDARRRKQKSRAKKVLQSA